MLSLFLVPSLEHNTSAYLMLSFCSCLLACFLASLLFCCYVAPCCGTEARRWLPYSSLPVAYRNKIDHTFDVLCSMPLPIFSRASSVMLLLVPWEERSRGERRTDAEHPAPYHLPVLEMVRSLNSCSSRSVPGSLG
jgi:hypothetical protein